MLTVGDWLAHWLVTKTATAPSTVRGYAAHVRLYLTPYLGEVLLAELTTGHVQAMVAAIIRQHHALGTLVSAATLTRIRATLRAALNAAIRRGLISENPAATAELPRARRPRAVVWTPFRVEQWRRTGERPAVTVWTAAQTAQFLSSVEGHRLYAAYHLIALRGLRRGEAPGCAGATSTWTARPRSSASSCSNTTAAWRSARPRPTTAPGSSPWTTRRSRRWPPAVTSSAPRRPRSDRGTGRPGSCSPT